MENFNYENENAYSQELYSSAIKKTKKKYGAGMIVLCCFISALIGALGSVAAVFVIKAVDNAEKTRYVEEVESKQNSISINVDNETVSVVEAVAQKVTPSVVGIRTTASVSDFFGSQESSGDGSGVIYRKDGYIITNYHVIADAVNNVSGKIEVFLDTTKSEPYIASVVGYNISADIAVIKIDANNLPAIEVADSAKLNAGQFVITVGNPGGLEFMDSVTYGVISGLDRVVSSDSTVSLIQTDAAINPGNSGGALVNVNGELVGINSSKIVAEEFEGMGFAVPSNTVVDICKKIIEKENNPEPYFGVSISERYTSEVLEYYGYPAGAVVLSVTDGSPAYEAGIRRGDIITMFDGTEIKEYTDLERFVSGSKPGEKVDVQVYRNGKKYITTVTIGSNNLVE